MLVCRRERRRVPARTVATVLEEAARTVEDTEGHRGAPRAKTWTAEEVGRIFDAAREHSLRVPSISRTELECGHKARRPRILRRHHTFSTTRQRCLQCLGTVLAGPYLCTAHTLPPETPIEARAQLAAECWNEHGGDRPTVAHAIAARLAT
jgi:hypothetical protein